MEKLCSCCNAAVDSEDAAILALGGFGNAKYLCTDCDSLLNAITRARAPEEIDGAVECLTSRMRRAGIDDGFVLKTVESVMRAAKERRDLIAAGEYDFDEEEKEDSELEEIPEELRESEEDRIADEIEAERAKKWDKVITAVAAVVFGALIAYLAYRFISIYFL